MVEQHRARNGYTTRIWHNLRTCRILYDSDTLLQTLQRMIDELKKVLP